ncbi:MAG TPA: zinc ABC transporter substrate-binding protein [Pseudonocardiaceae bacterium]|jgi:zinc/manganese transport system substrate-binding protein|nr:zinc ABC transporter substrate-binding protein [Pseudonocardiaceae bacterium]
MAPRVIAAALTVIGVLGVAACGTSAATSTDGRIPVVTSTDVWGSVVSAVGGGNVDVTAIIDNPSQDPHDYQSSPADAVKINAARLALYNGDGYDDFFAADLKATPSPSRATIVAFALAEQAANANEHVFYDLPTVVRVADAVAAQLGRIQPAHASTFRQNAAAFDKSVNGLLATVRQIGVRHSRKQVVVTEPVADYLLTAAGIADATPPAFERAVESDTDIPVAAISAATDLITKRQVAALINNVQTVTNVTSQLATTARKSNVPVVQVTETLPADVSGYLPWMTSEVNALAAAMGS